MTLLDAQEIDPEKTRKRKVRIIFATVLVVIVLVIGLVGFMLGHGWWFRYWPEEHIVGKFFDSLQKQDFKSAYGIWMHDPQWQQHPEQHPKYPFNEFYRDWGPGGEWGTIKTQSVYGASRCPGACGRSSSGPGLCGGSRRFRGSRIFRVFGGSPRLGPMWALSRGLSVMS